MTIDQLKYFVELARYEHVGKAAIAAHISPSALSTAVTSLERELGRSLFLREGKRLRLADDGKKLFETVTRLLTEFHEIPRTVFNTAVELSGNPRIGASHFLASHVLSPAWASLQEKHAHLGGEITSLASASVLNEVVSGALDFGLVFSPFHHPSLAQKILHVGRLILAVRKGHPLSKMPNQRMLKELENYPAVIHKGRPGVDLCEAHPIFEKYGIVPRITLAFDNDDCAVQKVRFSDAWTMIPDLVLDSAKKDLAPLALPKEWDAVYNITAVYRQNRPIPGMLTQLMRELNLNHSVH